MDLVFIGNSHLDKFQVTKERVIQLSGASIRGLRNPNSSTGMNRQIHECIAKSPSAYLLFHLGQVDIEFGYYYKSVLQNEKLDMEEFQTETIEIFKIFLQSLPCRIGIIGVHASAIADMRHTFSVNFKDFVCHANNSIQETGLLNEIVVFDTLRHIYNDSHVDRNQYLKRFNERLEVMCEELNIAFCDIWNKTASSESDFKFLRDDLQPIQQDHHVRTDASLGAFVSSFFQIVSTQLPVLPKLW